MRRAARPLPTEPVRQLEVQNVLPNPLQPRRIFREGALRALAQSISSQGMIQPIVVRNHPQRAGYFELVAGERRLRALEMLGRKTVPALIRAIPDDALLEVALVENLQREQLNPIEEARAYRTLLETYGYTQETLAARVGKDRSTIANLVRLLALPPALQGELEEERLTIGHARALLALPAAEARLKLGRRVVAQRLSVRETERLVKRASAGEKRGGRTRVVAAGPKMEAVREALEQKLATRVTIAPAADHGGSIGIEYYSLEDLNRILELLLEK